MDGQFNARTLIEEPEYTKQLQQIQPDVRRIDEQLQGVTWVLARKPEMFTKIDGTKLYGLKTDLWPNAPELRIYYTFNDNCVNLLWIEIVQDK